MSFPPAHHPDGVGAGLPRSAVLVLWANARLSGRVGPSELLDAVTGDDPAHLVLDEGGTSAPLAEVLETFLRDAGGATLALPAPGDPAGLAGPPHLNQAALEAGQAALLGTIALVPTLDARAVFWRRHRAEPAPVLDDREAGRMLRQEFGEAVARLSDLDVASWQPEIPDTLLNLRHRPPLPLPPGADSRQVETLERASLCLEIVELAQRSTGGAVSAHEIEARRQVLDGLSRAARAALVAAASAPPR